MAALMLLYPPIAINFWLAQSEIVLLAIFVLALAALRRGYHGRAGVILAAAALLRAYPLGMLGYLVARRNWRASGYFLAACVIGCALVVLAAVAESFQRTNCRQGIGPSATVLRWNRKSLNPKLCAFFPEIKREFFFPIAPLSGRRSIPFSQSE